MRGIRPTGPTLRYGTLILSLASLASLALTACGSSSSGNGGAVEPSPASAVGNALSYGGVGYGLTYGFEESFLFSPDRQGDTHSSSTFGLADAPFLRTYIVSNRRTVWRPNEARVWLRATLRSPGGEGFESATFAHEPNTTDGNDPAMAGRPFFQKGRFGVDVDGNGSIDSGADEFVDIVSGSIAVTRLEGGARVSVDVVLADGVPVTASFEGAFPLFEN